HLIFNLIGVCWMLIAIYPVMHAIDAVILSFSDNPASIMSSDPEARPNATLGLSLFHTSFNILNVILLFAFIPAIVRFIERILPDDGEEDNYHLRYISTGLMHSPALSIEQAQKEVQQFAEIVTKMHKKVNKLLFDPEAKRQKLTDKIAQLEDTTDQLEIEIADYLVRVTEDGNLEQALTERIRFMQSMINDMERIADIYFQISKLSERMLETKTQWPQEAVEDLNRMMTAVQNAINNMCKNVALNAEDVDLDSAIALENAVDELRDQFRNNHYDRLEQSAYSPRAGVSFIDVLNRLERIGDHILNVNESAAGKSLKATRIAANR
ncbi:MAG: PhoU domain-containing protein, partial [Pseudomonadota bacterium]